MQDRVKKLENYYRQVIFQYKVQLTKVELEMEELKRSNSNTEQEMVSTAVLEAGGETSLQPYSVQQGAGMQSSPTSADSGMFEPTYFPMSNHDLREGERIPEGNYLDSSSAWETYSQLHGVLSTYCGGRRVQRKRSARMIISETWETDTTNLVSRSFPSLFKRGGF